MTVQLIQFCPSLYNYYKVSFKRGTWHRDQGLSLFPFYKKTFLQSVVSKQPKNVKFSLWSIIEICPRGPWLFRGGAKILRGGAKWSQGRCAPPPQNPAMGMPKILNCRLVDFNYLNEYSCLTDIIINWLNNWLVGLTIHQLLNSWFHERSLAS
jgi:hypothetical protein